MNEHNSEQLDLLATEYLLDGLSPEDRADFRRRLAEDQAAREALADAVELVAAIVAAEDERIVRLPGGRSSRPRRFSAAVAALAVCLLLVLSWRTYHPAGTDDAPGAGPLVATEADSAEARLAAAWMQVRGQLATESDGDAREFEGASDLDVEPFELLEPPTWMLAALIEMQREESPEVPEALK